MTKTKIALAAALFAATSSAALAQGNDHSHSAAAQHRNARVQSAPVLQQRDVSLPTEGTPAGPFWYSWGGPTKGGM
ncbi:MAG: hypothetical protein WDO17_02925 [Alphaproteobacteria bacterium]